MLKCGKGETFKLEIDAENLDNTHVITFDLYVDGGEQIGGTTTATIVDGIGYIEVDESITANWPVTNGTPHVALIKDTFNGDVSWMVHQGLLVIGPNELG